jgi:hypothetical protein
MRRFSHEGFSHEEVLRRGASPKRRFASSDANPQAMHPCATFASISKTAQRGEMLANPQGAPMLYDARTVRGGARGAAETPKSGPEEPGTRRNRPPGAKRALEP